ncbi:Zonadhesin [Wickerhamomyces ciferrii]|uniref:Zonadhesin n=1 Tax=Wickerhamomyces ciferrii (strain ATCC 14091 / BCRC 22168 / CBS 111 / JCM 3599 / NBRC 0793 / NRRL Y-1031 F-60-10) TaxID=1206466 RepID=K0KQE8_WICCF|nr:Zonadhesin [Wickerhamomyces ciferrii]CCH43473.1 Zonadhesin [Wickerhamomyces ciferrii]
MRFQTLAALSLASIALADKTEIINGVYNDINSHLEEYLKIIDQVPSDLLQLFKQAQTYTDDSYTTLYDNVDLNEVSTFATGLDWYDQRLKSIFGDDASPSTEAPEVSTTSDAPVSSSAAPVESSTVEPASSSQAPVESSTQEQITSSVAPVEPNSNSTNNATTPANTFDEENSGLRNSLGVFAPVVVALGAVALL